MPNAPALPESIEELKAFAASLLQQVAQQSEQLSDRTLRLEHQAAQLNEQSAYIEKLKFELARLRQWRFGHSSESLGSEQLALWTTELDSDIAAAQSRLNDLPEDDPAQDSEPRHTAKRKPLPDWLPRIDERHELASTDCPDCGRGLERIGEDISEKLDVIPAQFFVRRHIRSKYCCRGCQRLHTAPMPAQPIDKGIAAPGLLAHVLVSKYKDSLPLYRQEEMYARLGVQLSRSSMAGWIGQLEVLLEPLVNRLKNHVLADGLLQVDETPVPVLAPGTGKTVTGYLWAYRTGPWSPLQAVAFDFAMSRSQATPNRTLGDYRGIVQVDGYAGYNAVLSQPGVIEAGCMAHARRKFTEVWDAHRSPLAQTALTQIGKLYQIEAELRELPGPERQAARQVRAGPVLENYRQWLELTCAKLSERSALAKSIRYSLNRWPALTRYLTDGRINIDNNPVENTIRGIALGKKNFLFCGSEGGGHRAAMIYCLIESAKLNHVDPYAYLVYVLTKLPTARPRDLDALLPWNYRA